MPSSIYCIAFPVQNEPPSLLRRKALIHDLLREVEIDFKEPKLGLHVTIIPPFRAEEKDARLIALGVQIMKAIHAQRAWETVMKVEEEHCFENDDSFAIVLKTSINEIFEERVTEWRACFGSTLSWVYPPANYFYKPHITVAECSRQEQKDQHQQLQGIGWRNRLPILPEVSIPLGTPQVFEKGVDGWKPVFF